MTRSTRLSPPMLALTALAALGCIAGVAAAQPDRPEHEPKHESPQRSVERDMLAPDENPGEFLRMRIERLDQERDQLAQALTQVEAGKDWGEIREDLMRTRGPQDQRGRRSGPGQAFDADEALEQLTLVDPEAAERFAELEQTNPRIARRLLQVSAPRLNKLEMLRQNNPELYEIEAEQFRIDRKIMHLARSLHQTIAGRGDEKDPPSLENVRAELRALVSRQVDLQIESQRLQLKSAEDRIAKLSERIEARVESRDGVVEDRIDRILERAVRSGADRRQHGPRDGRPGRERPNR